MHSVHKACGWVVDESPSPRLLPEIHRVPTTITNQWDQALASVRSKIGADNMALSYHHAFDLPVAVIK